jgi:hypothetical protein
MATERERDLKMFGCPKEEIDAALGRFWKGLQAPHLRLALAFLSDAQELLVYGHDEQVRQLINRAKYLLMKGIDGSAA